MKSNKEIVKEFYDKVFNGWDLSVVDRYMRDDYKQHSPEVADGKAGFLEFFKGFLANKPKCDIIKMIAEDDMVCVFFKCTFGTNGMHVKVFDLYRLEDGMLAEHWDCTMLIDNVPVNNPNGHF